MNEGVYEELVTKLIAQKLTELDRKTFYVKTKTIDKAEAAQILSRQLGSCIQLAFSLVKGKDQLGIQIKLANKIILFLRDEIDKATFENDLIDEQGDILQAVFNKINNEFSDLDLRLKEITPYTRFSHSELFIGGNGDISLLSELKKEILSSDRIDLLVSFIKHKGVIILMDEFKEFTKRGGKLRIITTTYVGATDQKAIDLLTELDNTEVKISYNTGNERLHAKAYLFYRHTGFHTAYIGSSNFSRSALTDGLEWNMKVTTKEISHVIDKFKKTFNSYWENPEFCLYDPLIDSQKLSLALSNGKFGKAQPDITAHFDIKPHTYQELILEKLRVERNIHNRFKNLVVAATGTGKTVISAFDFKYFLKEHPKAKLLFIAHRKEILKQAMVTFRGVLKDNNFGELLVDGIYPSNYSAVFASVQSLKSKFDELNLSSDYYDFIIIDEVHHIAATSYRPVLEKFSPKILLGLTATPERMDGVDILEDFDGKIAAEIRLPEALNKKLLCPFHYFGISDSIDLTHVRWSRGKYDISELTKVYTSNDQRVGEIIKNLNYYTKEISDVRALGFCISIEHAEFMAAKFLSANLKAAALTSNNTSERDDLRIKLKRKEINYLFVVDVFNEGVDIPEIDTVLFLRPTESLTIFIQQLGRGLRLTDDKEVLTVLDFVGNARPEYDFEHKFRALIGKSNTSVQKEIEDDFPHLPLGCSIVLEKKAKASILENIKNATNLNVNKIIERIKNFKHQTILDLNLSNFTSFTHIPLSTIYKKGTWHSLLARAGMVDNYNDDMDSQIQSMIRKKWLSTSSISYFKFILSLAEKDFKIDTLKRFSAAENKMLLMLHYDCWQTDNKYSTLKESIKAIGSNKYLVKEIIDFLLLMIDQISSEEFDIDLPYKQPLKVHGRYTRDQILAAFELSTFDKKSSNREGVAENKKLKTELLFIDLIKSEEDFSPTTRYDDYAISESLFHWQTQNKTRNDSGKGLTYIKHQKLGKKILLFVREQSKNEFENTNGYVFLGEGKLKEYYGSKPMSIVWQLSHPIPHFLWKESAKMAVG